MTVRLLVLVTGILLHQSILALPSQAKRLPELSDFRFRQTITVGEKAVAYSFQLPDAVYQNVGHEDFEHMAVFNAKGELVPWRIRNSSNLPQWEKSRLPLVLFDARPNQTPQMDGEKISVYRDEATIRVDVTLDGNIANGLQQAGSNPNTYYVDLAEVEDRYNLKQLYFSISGTEPWEADVRVSQSSNFKNWRKVAEERLFHYRKQQKTLKNWDMSVSGIVGPYLKIEVLGQGELPRLNSLTGLIEIRAEKVATERWFAADLKRGDVRGEYLVELPARHYLKGWQIESAHQNSLGTVRIFALLGGQWRPVQQASLSQIQRTNDRVTLHNAPSSTQWKLVFTSPSVGYFDDAPSVQYAVAAYEMSFVAYGEGPYTLAYGIDPVRVKQIEWAGWKRHPNYPNAKYHSRDVSLQKPPQATFSLDSLHLPSNQSYWLFWAGAILFVLVMLSLAVYLFREINSGLQKREQDS